MTDWLSTVALPFGVAIVVTTLAQPLVISVLKRRGVMDVPNGRSSHEVPTPRGGGIAVLLAAAVGLGAAAASGDGAPLPLLAVIGCTLAAAIGGLDDLRGLGARSRLVGQFVVALLAIGSLAAFPQFAGTALPSTLVGLLLLILVVGYINAFNFMDGINGISGLNGTVAACWFCGLGIWVDAPGLAAAAASLAGACAAFLPWNFPRARVFLGDVGSYFLGSVLVTIALLLWDRGVALPLVLAPMAVYVVDTGSTLLRRLRAGKSLTEPHREHVYQQMSAAWGHAPASLVNVACAGAVLGTAALSEALGSPAWLGLAVVPLGLYVLIGSRTEVAHP